MRKRNIEFINSIGELTEEIANQELELVNGGEDKVTPVDNPDLVTKVACTTVMTKPSAHITDLVGCPPMFTYNCTKDCK